MGWDRLASFKEFIHNFESNKESLKAQSAKSHPLLLLPYQPLGFPARRNNHISRVFF